MRRKIYKEEIVSWINEIKEKEKWFVEPKYYYPKEGDAISVGMLTHFGYSFTSVALGALAIYHSINRDVNCHGIADRVFIYDPIANSDGFTSVDADLEGNLITFERNIPLDQLDLICISLTDSDAITTVLHLLKFGGIPINKADRKNGRYPLLLAGGPGCGNPEAFADFFDMITIGDGCVLTPNIVNAMYLLKKRKSIISVKTIYQQLSNTDGLYIPEFYTYLYAGEKIEAILCDPKVNKIVPAVDPPIEWTYGSLFSSGDTAVILPNRGCKNRCAYCQLGLQKYREMPDESLLQLVDKYLSEGITNIIVNSASVTQYANVVHLLGKIADMISECSYKVNVYIGSLCFNELNRDILGNLNRLGAFTHTYMLYTDAETQKFMALAPEHGSEDLLHSLGRILKPWEILEAIDMAAEVGVYNFNLYFIVGFPSETSTDRAETASLVAAIADKIYPNKGKVIVKINPLIPTPGTACQRMNMSSVDQYKEYILEIKKGVIEKIGEERYDEQIDMVPLPEERLIVESLIDRADRRIGFFIQKLFEYRASGKKIATAILNGWIEEIGFSWEGLTGQRLENDILPWNNIDFGTSSQESRVIGSIKKRIEEQQKIEN